MVDGAEAAVVLGIWAVTAGVVSDCRAPHPAALTGTTSSATIATDS
jgi:hypothetical protein